MSISEKEIEEILRENKGGTLEEYHGPSAFGNQEVWEIWVYKDGAYDTRFVMTGQNLSPVYLDGFQSLCLHLDRIRSLEHSQMEGTVEKLTEVNQRLKGKSGDKLLMRSVAAVVFLASVGALLFMLLKSGQTSGVLLTILVGIIASGAVMFFGNWRQPTLP